MMTGKLGDEMDPNVPFRLNVSQYRRKKILGFNIIIYLFF